MKILQVLPTLGSGGAEHFTVGLVNELIHQGYECDIVTLFDVDKDNYLLKELSSKSHHSSLHKKAGFDWECYHRLYKFIKKGGYEVASCPCGIHSLHTLIRNAPQEGEICGNYSF